MSLSELLGDLQEPEASETSRTALCNTHYHRLYRELNSPQACAACGTHPRYGGKYGERYVRCCPAPQAITEYLQQNEGFTGELTASSRICCPCYLHHRAIVSSSACGPLKSLADIADALKERIGGRKTGMREDEYLQWLVCRIALRLTNSLTKDEVTLLPELYQEFSSIAVTISKYAEDTSLASQSPTARCLLSCLSSHLEDRLGKHRRFGTVLYHKYGDILSALSKALGRTQRSEAGIRQEYACQLEEANEAVTQQDIAAVCRELNIRIHTQIKKLRQTYCEYPLMCATFSPDLLIKELDPVLVQVANPASDNSCEGEPKSASNYILATYS